MSQNQSITFGSNTGLSASWDPAFTNTDRANIMSTASNSFANTTSNLMNEDMSTNDVSATSDKYHADPDPYGLEAFLSGAIYTSLASTNKKRESKPRVNPRQGQHRPRNSAELTCSWGGVCPGDFRQQPRHEIPPPGTACSCLDCTCDQYRCYVCAGVARPLGPNYIDRHRRRD